MRRTVIPTVVAGLGTGVVVSGFAAILYHNVFFYTADGYISPKTAVCLGLLEMKKPRPLADWPSRRVARVVISIEKEE